MKITVVGTGNMGAGFVKQFSAAGHQVRVTGRDTAKAQALASRFTNVTALDAANALADSEVVVLAVGYADAPAALLALGDLTGRVVIDITNPLTPDYMALTLGHTTSASEELAKRVPGAHVVKAFNTVLAQVLDRGPAFAAGQIAPVFIAGDDAAAKAKVQALAESAGFKSVDAGGLKNARYLEPLAGLNIYFAYGAGQGTQIAPTWLHRD
ncbi:MAG: NAD(P)-binding domain-containing protein [Ottowia sp.]|nr:NAD(P)-binding domain-containing protein [Ottowia sp.]